MTSSISTHEAGQSKPVLWDNPEGWDGVRHGGYKGQLLSLSPESSEAFKAFNPLT